MSRSILQRWCMLGGFVLFFAGPGCEGEPRVPSEKRNQSSAKTTLPKQTPEVQSVDLEPKQAPKERPAASGATGGSGELASPKKVRLGKSVWFETEGKRRRVLVETAVCLREGGLECLLCRTHSKEHESILSTDADAQVIHAGLLAAGAKPGSPVQYVEKKGEVVIVPPTGSRIQISVQYEDKGKTVTRAAQQWILNAKTKKDLEDEWVFAGSRFLPSLNDENQKPVYAATSDGSYICVYNMPYAMLDLPVNNPNKDPEIRELQPQTNRIPPLGTEVILILEPKADDKGNS